MVYIYKKEIAGKPRYYLRASVRKGARVLVKDIAYLGDCASKIQKALDSLDDYRQDIRKAHTHLQKAINTHFWLEKAQEKKLKKNAYLGSVQLEVCACQLHFVKQFLKKNQKTQNEILTQFSVDFSYNTTSIEGNTITLDQARKYLLRGLTPPDKTLREIHDLQNTQTVFLQWDSFSITHDSIRDLHKQLIKHIDERTGYRNEDVRVFRSRFDATPAKFVQTDMQLLIDWYNKNKKTLHPFVLACLFHHKFEKIHPFMDGNGRTGRMLLNIILLQNKYPPLIVENKMRLQYLRFLSDADRAQITSMESKFYRPLVEFLGKELVSQYWNIFL
ncbi:MAG: Fic family protein [Candidatus Woesearchaeota archaeon]